MEIKWTKFALENLSQYQNNSKKTSKNLNKYYENLINSINLLKTNPLLGKNFYIIDNYEIRQLIHKEHRILYLMDKNEIILLSLVHTNFPLNQALNNIKKYILEL